MAPRPRPLEEQLKIREQIDRLRGERKLSGVTLAALSGIPISSYRRKMDSKVDNTGDLTISELVRLADALGVPLTVKLG